MQQHNNNDKRVNYCRADNKVIDFKCPDCSFFKKMDEDIYNFFSYLSQIFKDTGIR